MTELKMICARRAYRDFCRTLKFTEFSKKDSVNQKYHDLFCEVICKHIVSEIDKLIETQDQTVFNSRHNTICKDIMEMANSAKTEDKFILADRESDISNNDDRPKKDRKAFHYGQAQKWLNMTMKYLWIAGAFKDKGHVKEFLHIPVDSYIIKAVYKNEEIVLPLRNVDESKKLYGIDKYVSWSQWTETDYCNFQKSIRKLKLSDIPIEWENKKWFEIAQENLIKINDNFEKWKKEKSVNLKLKGKPIQA